MLNTNQPVVIRQENEELFTAFFPDTGIVLSLNPISTFWIQGVFQEGKTIDLIAQEIASMTTTPFSQVKHEGEAFLLELEQILAGKKTAPILESVSLPTSAEIYIGDGCNLTCPYCPQTIHKGFTPVEQLLETVQFLAEEIKIFFMKFLGGETLLHPGIWQILDLAASYGVHLTVITNGTTVTDKIADRLASYKNLTLIVIIDGLAPTHDKLRGRVGTFDLAFGAAKKMRKRNRPTGITFTMNQQNMAEWKALAILATLEGVVLGINPTKPYHTGDLTNTVPPEHVFRIFHEAFVMKLAGFKIDLMIAPLESVLKGEPILANECEAGASFLSVMKNGDMTPCSSFFYAGGHGHTPLTNISELSKAWNTDAAFQQFRTVFKPKGCAVRDLLFGGNDPYSPEAFQEWLATQNIALPVVL